MEEERVNTGKSTEMELKVIIMTMMMISLSFLLFFVLLCFKAMHIFPWIADSAQTEYCTTFPCVLVC